MRKFLETEGRFEKLNFFVLFFQNIPFQPLFLNFILLISGCIFFIYTRLENAAKTALNNWIAVGRARIDQALEDMTRYRAFTPSSIFSNAIFEYELHQSAAGMVTKFVPATWSTALDDLSWETVTVHEKETEDHIHKGCILRHFQFQRRLFGGALGRQCIRTV